MYHADPVGSQCAGATSAGAASFTDAGLDASHTTTDSEFSLVAYVEVHAVSANRSLGVTAYRYDSETVSGTTVFTMNATVPLEALLTLTGAPEEETFVTRPVVSTIISTADPNTPLRFIDNPAITAAVYGTLRFSEQAQVTLLATDGTDVVVRRTAVLDGVVRSAAPDITKCHLGSAQVAGAGVAFPSFEPPDAGPAEPAANRTRGGDDWALNPTFGRSWDSGARVVEGGFSFNGMYLDVTDNHHVDLARTVAGIGEVSTVTMKVFAGAPLDTVSLHLGVPGVSRATESEADIHVRVVPDHYGPDGYAITGISHRQGEPLVDEAATGASVRKAECSPATEAECHEFTIQFRVLAPLSSDVLAISAMDVDRRITTTYVNDGVGFEGEPLVPAETATLQVKRGNQHPVEEVYLVRDDRRHDSWTDQHGNQWTRNSHGSWHLETPPGFERFQDPYVSVMTRTHSAFADMVEEEKKRAQLVMERILSGAR